MDAALGGGVSVCVKLLKLPNIPRGPTGGGTGSSLTPGGVLGLQIACIRDETRSAICLLSSS